MFFRSHEFEDALELPRDHPKRKEAEAILEQEYRLCRQAELVLVPKIRPYLAKYWMLPQDRLTRLGNRILDDLGSSPARYEFSSSKVPVGFAATCHIFHRRIRFRDSVNRLPTLLHELAHLPGIYDHGPEFTDMLELIYDAGAAVLHQWKYWDNNPWEDPRPWADKRWKRL